MNSKLFVVFATLFAVLLVEQAACESESVEKPDQLYILNPGSAFPVIVTDPNSPLLTSQETTDRQVIRICIFSQCQSVCRSWGFIFGRCNVQAICVCSNR